MPDAETSPKGMGILIMFLDTISIGSTGFAQVGDPDYLFKANAEKTVLLEYFHQHFPFPEEFAHFCSFHWKSFPHDFGTYYELVIVYDQAALESSDNPFFADEFWDFVNSVLDVYLEDDKFIRRVKKQYMKMLDEKTAPPASLSAVA